MFPSGRGAPRRSRTTRFIAASSVLALGLLGAAVPSPALAATYSVTLQNLQYNPASITVAVGDTVTWSNSDSVIHSVTGGPLNSPDLGPGASYSFTFTGPGTVDYRCKFHPDMVGRVVVESGGPSPTTTTAPPTSSTSTPSPTATQPPTATPPPGGGGGTATSAPGGAPVGVGPLPVSFDLTDANGSWFDTNLNLGPSIGQSLAVAVLPRVNLGSVLNGVPSVNPSGIPLLGGGGLPDVGGLLPGAGGGALPGLPDLGAGLPGLPGGGGGLPGLPGLPGGGGGALPDVGGLLPGLGGGLPGTGDIPLLGGGSLPLLDGTTVPLLGGGLLAGLDAAKTLNLDNITQVNSVLGKGGLPLLGDLGVDPNSLFNLDAMRQAIFQLLPTGDQRISKANSLLDQLTSQVKALPADAPISLDSLPVGPELEDLLEDLRTFAENDVQLPVTVNFNIESPDAESAHTPTSLIWPEGAKGFPADVPGAFVGATSYQLTEPGLYAFTCKIHPYMLGAIVVDDPLTLGLDFGKKLGVNARGLSVPSNADIIAQLVQKFFVITVKDNWQTFSDTEERTWNPQFPPAPILMYDDKGRPELVPSLDSYLKSKFGFPKKLPALGKKPSTPGVGDVWIATQMEEYAEKSKTGSITKVDTATWNVEQKISAPEINQNNIHNMWTDKNETVLYGNEWFGDEMNTYDLKTGKFIRQLEVGPDPSHVMSRTDTDQLHVAINGGGSVLEIAPGGTRIDRRLPVQAPGGKIAHPHAHWMTGDAKIMATPNVNTYNATLVDIPTGNIRHEKTGEMPIATGMTPDGKKTYMADFLGATVSCISNYEDACVDGSAKAKHKSINLWGSYDPVAGGTGPFGGLPIQLPVAPDNSALLVANTLTSNITVIDPKTDEIVKWLPCDAGCHGINFGAKKGGGYYAYVSSKFANTLSVVDTDPNGDGNPEDAAVVGKMVLDGNKGTVNDGTITKWAGFGGQGVLPIPLAYEGWVQNAPSNPVNDQLTCRQRHPVTYATDCS
ncbi:cupredoxin domain-containing protein [Actinokineospora xionganensis]|uniref:Cupredoxin domain-containing protein n=1 Tax=Actinokineospora xionganensis TaxID=2684470 RepID=A0ABR7L5T9_9PSEU|nr:cupredoxin domain-containing protein [Actinokineospora xionganensis]MBC6448052.1 cupredoxin domain-containing protein [Actinokineospora xionganensis]